MKLILIVLVFYLISKIFNNLKINKKNKNSDIIDVDFEEVDESN
tara:strand:- start:217 stop:348 length:132 start_codon:yes stop_codon:yes gene_type:complete